MQEQSRLVLAEESKEQAQVATLEARATLERAKQRLLRRQVELARAPKGSPEAAMLRVEIGGSTSRVVFLEDRAKKLEQLRSRIGIREGIERQQLGLVFELVDHGAAEEPPPLARRMVILVIGILSFLVLIPLIAVVLGAFDSRVLDLGDVRRMGLVGLGHVAGFPGDNFGSLESRRRRGDGVH